MKTEKEYFAKYLLDSHKKRSGKREIVLQTFLKAESHVSAEDLYEMVRARHPEIGRSTVYRALKLLCDSGIAREVDLKDGRMRYEHQFQHPHHDHMVCTSCGRTYEFISREIEALQERVTASIGFTASSHALQIFGQCKTCRGGGKPRPTQSPPPSRPPIEIK